MRAGVTQVKRYIQEKDIGSGCEFLTHNCFTYYLLPITSPLISPSPSHSIFGTGIVMVGA
jgi:hypothetical protein